MSNKMDVVIAGITSALKNAESSDCADFVIGNTTVKIDPRGISILLNESDLEPVALRIHRPNIDTSCWGYVLVGHPDKPKGILVKDGAQGFNVIACL
jgi:hypothetical protein